LLLPGVSHLHGLRLATYQDTKEDVSLEPMQAFHRSADGLHLTLRRYTLPRSAFHEGRIRSRKLDETYTCYSLRAQKCSCDTYIRTLTMQEPYRLSMHEA